MADWGFELRSLDSSRVGRLRWFTVNYSPSCLFQMVAFSSIGEVKIPAVNHLVNLQAELPLRQSSVICIVISMLVQSLPSTVMPSITFDIRLFSLFWTMLSFVSTFVDWDTPALIFLVLAPPVMALAQTIPAASCYSPVLKITTIPGETSYIIHGFDLLISIKPENDIFAGCIPMCIILDI